MSGTENNLWAIIYVSSAMKDLSLSQVSGFVEMKRKTRIEQGVTGLVILAQNNVLVVQEGLSAGVKGEFEDDRKHPGHHTMIKLFDGPIKQRFFEGFPLAFKPIGNKAFNHMDDFITPENKEYFEEILQMEHLISKLMRDFIKNNS